MKSIISYKTSPKGLYRIQLPTAKVRIIQFALFQLGIQKLTITNIHGMKGNNLLSIFIKLNFRQI